MRSFCLAVVVLWLPSLALADAVGLPREDCAPGTEDVFCHGPPTCRPFACSMGCPDGTSCSEERFCIVRNNCGGRTGTPVYDNALGACRSDSDCADVGGTCQLVQVCVNDGCGCGVPGRAGASPLGWALSLLAFVLWRRRS